MERMITGVLIDSMFNTRFAAAFSNCSVVKRDRSADARYSGNSDSPPAPAADLRKLRRFRDMAESFMCGSPFWPSVHDGRVTILTRCEFGLSSPGKMIVGQNHSSQLVAWFRRPRGPLYRKTAMSSMEDAAAFAF
jgi:hypothetical protein